MDNYLPAIPEKTKKASGIRPLVKNELIKIVSQKSLRVIFAIFLVITLLLPLAVNGLDALIGVLEADDPSNDLDTANNYLKNGMYASAAFYNGRYEGASFFSSNGIESGSVRYKSFSGDLTTLYITRNELNVISSGQDTYKNMFDNGWFTEYINEYYIGLYGLPKEFEKNESEDQTEAAYADLSAYLDAEVIGNMRESVQNEITKLEKQILSFDLSAYYDSMILDAQIDVENNEAIIKASDAVLALDSANKDAKYAKEVATVSNEALAYYIDALKLLAEKNTDSTDWQYNTAEMMRTAANAAASTVPVDSDSFSSGYFSRYYKSYKDYCKALEGNRKNAFSALKTGLFSIEKNAPLQTVFESSQRSLFHFELGTAAQFIAIIMILLSAISLTAEYSSGSIRLLLIRPKSRSKILASKLISLAVVWGVLLVAAYLILLIINVALGAGNDIFEADVYHLFGKNIKVNFLFSSLLVLLLKTVCSVPVVALAFFLGVISTKIAPAIILPIALFSVGNTVQQLSLIAESFGLKFVRFLPTSYVDLTTYLDLPANSFVTGNSSSLSYLLKAAGSLAGYSTSAFYPWLGLFYILAASAALIAVCFPVFNKQQIKA